MRDARAIDRDDASDESEDDGGDGGDGERCADGDGARGDGNGGETTTRWARDG